MKNEVESTHGFFDINGVLHNVYLNLKSTLEQTNNELTYFMNKTVPRYYEGDSFAYESLLTDVFEALFSLFDKTEILMNINAPEHFMLQDDVSFEIVNIPIKSRRTLEVMMRVFKPKISHLNGVLEIDAQNNIVIKLPMKTAKMGERRFYRLPSRAMLGKRILFLMHNGFTLMSLVRMFKYFPYDLEVGMQGYLPQKHDLKRFDMILCERGFFSYKLAEDLDAIRREKEIKLIVAGEKDGSIPERFVTAYLHRPMTQSTIFEMIVSLFYDESKTSTSLREHQEGRDFTEAIERIKQEKGIVLDKNEGKANARRIGVSYIEILENFLDQYEGSDLYFKDLIMKERYEEVMEFLHELKMASRMIGAHDMLAWIKMFETTWRFQRTDLLPTYPGKYHIELDRLCAEIERYLYGKTSHSV